MKTFPAAVQGLIALILMTLPLLAISQESPRILADKEFYTKGCFIAYAAPWSTYFGEGMTMKHGIDYADEIAVRPGTFPAGVDISWHWPLVPAKHTGVYGYNALSFGSYDGGVPEVPVAPRQVKGISALSVTYSYSFARAIGDFNVLCEFFLTKEPGGTKLSEVGFFPHAAMPTLGFAGAGEQLGTFIDMAGRTWKVVKQSAPHGAPYYMFVPPGDIFAATIDFKAALDFLRAKGQLTGDGWLSGIAFGVEPVTGSGSIRVENLSVNFR